MFNWGKSKHCKQCKDKDVLIGHLQETIHTMAQDAVAAEEKNKQLLKELRDRPTLKEVDTGSENFLVINRLMNEKSRLLEENNRLRGRYDFIANNSLPSELNRDIMTNALPARLSNLFKSEMIESYVDLVDKTEAELLRTPNFGVKTLKVLKEHLISEFPDFRQHFALLKEMP